MIATLALVGATTHQPVLTSWLPNTKPMMAVPALSFGFLSFFLWIPLQTNFQSFLKPLYKFLLSGIMVLILMSLFRPTWFETSGIAIPTGIGLLLGAIGLFIYCSAKTVHPNQNFLISLLGLSVIGLGLFSLGEYIIRLSPVYAALPAIEDISIPSSVCLVLLGTGINYLSLVMPVPKLLFERTLRHSLIRIYLGVSLLLVAAGSFFSVQMIHRLIFQMVPQEIVSSLGSTILSNLIHLILLGVSVGVVFVVLVGMYLSSRFKRSFEELKTLAYQIEKGQISPSLEIIEANEWEELKDVKGSLIHVGRNLIEARQNLESKLKELETTGAELRDSQKIALSLLEDTENANRQLEEAKGALQQLNLTLETKVEERTRELKLAQEKLVRTEKLAALGQLASAVAHEIRNPLTGLTNSAYFLKLCEDEIKSMEVKKHVELINKQVGNIDQIISNLLEFARVKEPEKKETDVRGLIQSVIEKFPPPSNVRLLLETPSKIPTIKVDPFQMGQVLGNLMTNAYQAMAKGGELKIAAEDKSGVFSITCQDTGSGITSENLTKIFEPLFSTKPKGTGLGLAICKQLVEKQGGTLEVESTPGKGSRFIVKLSRGG
ncbi:MAG: hypothetical protein A2712_09990 [Deltaproteobacteria bacterium RIFCSPHIGHO2_01_FULL_43_49]|nr:MAG: hypothetical protein A2712_09990 [Deltaproteobacteria bacterium RIFCSPHIGHO2_01_FULL_43_49]